MTPEQSYPNISALTRVTNDNSNKYLSLKYRYALWSQFIISRILMLCRDVIAILVLIDGSEMTLAIARAWVLLLSVFDVRTHSKRASTVE